MKNTKIHKKIITLLLFFCSIVIGAESQNTTPVTLKVVDYTAGEITSDVKSIFSWVAMWDPTYQEFLNTNSWYSIFSDGYSGGSLEKSGDSWIWSYEFNAPVGGSFSWDPYLGEPTGGSVNLKNYFALTEDNKNFDFFVSESGEVTGPVTITLSFDRIKVKDVNDEVIVDKPYKLEKVVDNDFLHANGQWIVDGEGNRVILRSIGLGNYFLLEPYMLGITDARQTVRSNSHDAIMRSFAELAGEENANAFFDLYLDNYLTEDDIIFIKNSGFNSIRMSVTHNMFIETPGANNNFIEKGFQIVDEVLEWCEKHNVYLIIDMHTAPGGQNTSSTVSNSLTPGLWDGDENGTAEEYQEKYAILWGEIARRFGHSPWIGGYDLTNEINYYPEGRDIAQEIRVLYNKLISAVREHDTKHIVFVQGNNWGNDYDGLTPPWDDNMVYCFHHYWSPNNRSQIDKFLSIRDTYNAPIWMGESGENSNMWFTNAIELLENSEIGWSWWSYKKMNSISGILDVPRPENWDKVLTYLRTSTGSSSLTKEEANAILLEFAENTKLENAGINKDVIYAMFDQINNNETRPYGENKVPGKIYATEYDLGKQNYSYFETGLLFEESIGQGAYNTGWAGRNDAVDITRNNSVEDGNGFIVTDIEKSEWINYTVYAEEEGDYELSIVYAASTQNGNIDVSVNNVKVLSNQVLNTTGGAQTYSSKEVGNIHLNEGWNTIRFFFNEGKFNFSHFVLDIAPEKNEFLHTDGKWIVDGEGNRVIIRSIGLGNYFLLEPYMIGITNAAQTSRSNSHDAIMRSFAELAGEDNANAFFDLYLDNYLTEDDIKFIKNSGFNAVRMAVTHNMFIETPGANNNFIEKGFQIVDKVLEWCEKHNVYLIIDMHTAPGGQNTSSTVSNSPTLGLWDGDENGTAEEYQEKYAILWGEIARRFGHSPWIGGYDLTNEINYYPENRDIAQEIRVLYDKLVSAVREHDTKHIVFIQGNKWGNDYDGLTPPWDDNMVYCFHHYWSPNTKSQIEKFLSIRDTYNTPIWMGEGGENSNVWFTDAIELLENENIGWSWWSYKKMESISGTLSVYAPKNWDLILEYLKSTDKSSSLTQAEANTILLEFAENTKLSNAKVNKDVLYAMFDQINNNSTHPYGENLVPGVIYGTEYDMGRQGYAYYESGILYEDGSQEGQYSTGWVFRNDPVDMRKNPSIDGGNGFIVTDLENGEWLNYTVNVEKSGSYELKMIYSAIDKDGNIDVKVDDKTELKGVELKETGDLDTYETLSVGNVELTAGKNVLQLYFNSGINLSHFTLEYNPSPEKPDDVDDYSFEVFFDKITYTTLEDASVVKFIIYDASGRTVSHIIDEVLEQGVHEVVIPNNIRNGLHVINMIVEDQNRVVFKKTKKILFKDS